MSDIVLLLEEAIARHLGKILKNTKVELFADEFASTGKVTQRQQLLVGHQSSDFRQLNSYPITQVEEVAKYEIRLEVVDLKNHRQALSLMSSVVNSLIGFTPYTNVQPLIPVNYGAPRFSRESGIWVYTAVLQTSFSKPRPLEDFQLIEQLPDTEIVSVGLFNSWLLSDEDAVLVTQISKE